MTQEMETRLLETQLAELRLRFNDAASPILNRLNELRPSAIGSDRQLLIPRQPRRRTFGTRLPRQFA